MIETFYKIRGWTPPAFQFLCWLVIWLPFKGLWYVAFNITQFLMFLCIPDKHYEQVQRDLMTGRFNPDERERQRWIKYKL